ncbi:MAG: lycopene cyclase domain-containing protein [Anaerolineales bacterium]|nr:lycopene cyclase domain-containing protein [Anaerolineales bacterium]MDW8162646.1 lycopene cyclase domain-containing protein [Anaerolineales bacterium]
MTYFGFLLRFLVFPILALLLLTFIDERRFPPMQHFQNGKVVWKIIALHGIIAVIYTTPWDNYLVANGVWFYNPALVSGILLGYVPLEEYLFFVLETLLAGLWWWFLARRLPEPSNFRPSRRGRWIAFGVLLGAWALSAYLLFAGGQRWTYLSIILFWALPAMFPQFLIGADILWHYRRLAGLGILVPGAYLSAMDIVALSASTWSISPQHTTGLLLFGILPVEEVLFFFITNVLIIFGMTLMLSNLCRERFFAWRRRNFRGLP